MKHNKSNDMKERLNDIHGIDYWSDSCLSKLQENKFIMLTGNAQSGKTTLSEKIVKDINCGYMRNGTTHNHIIRLSGKSDTPLDELIKQVYDIFKLHTDLTLDDITYYLKQCLGFHKLLDLYKLPNNAQIIIIFDDYECMPLDSSTSCLTQLIIDTIHPFFRNNETMFFSEVYAIFIVDSIHIGYLDYFSSLVELINKSIFLMPICNQIQAREIIENTLDENDIKFNQCELSDYLSENQNRTFPNIVRFMIANGYSYF